jgi:large subunit ribosomal protein L35
MPKMKTRKGAAKRFGVTKSGKVKRAQAYKRHILTKKPTKRTRNLRKAAYLSTTEGRTIKKLIPYK